MAATLQLVPSKAPHSSFYSAPFAPPKLVEFKRHDRLPTGNGALWRIQRGYVRSLSWGLEGDPIPLGFWSTGDVLGEAIAQTSPYEVQCLSPVTAEALKPTYTFSRDAVLAQVQQSNELLKIVHCRQTEQRLLHFVCWLARRFGKPTPAGIAVSIRLTHQDIADAIATTRVTVTRLLKKVEREGKLRWSVQEKVIHAATLSQFALDINYQLTV